MAHIEIGHRLNRAFIRQHFLYGTFERFVGHRKCGFDITTVALLQLFRKHGW